MLHHRCRRGSRCRWSWSCLRSGRLGVQFGLLGDRAVDRVGQVSKQRSHRCARRPWRLAHARAGLNKGLPSLRFARRGRRGCLRWIRTRCSGGAGDVLLCHRPVSYELRVVGAITRTAATTTLAPLASLLNAILQKLVSDLLCSILFSFQGPIKLEKRIIKKNIISTHVDFNYCNCNKIVKIQSNYTIYSVQYVFTITYSRLFCCCSS